MIKALGLDPTAGRQFDLWCVEYRQLSSRHEQRGDA